MIHKVLRRVRVNFRSSNSQRAANSSYRQYHERIVKFFKRKPNFIKKGKNQA